MSTASAADSEFKWDVFLSHSSQDKDTVRDVANRLKSDGVRVWFDEWEIRPGDSIPAKIEDGLEHSRVLVLCLSQAALAADWPQLESHTFRFKDPLNHNRRFVPLRLDDTPTKGSLAQFSYIDWRPEQLEQKYSKLLKACQVEASQALDGDVDSIDSDVIQLESKRDILVYEFSKDCRSAIVLSGAHRCVCGMLPQEDGPDRLRGIRQLLGVQR